MKRPSCYWGVTLGVLLLCGFAATAQRMQEKTLVGEEPIASIQYSQSAEADLDGGGKFSHRNLQYQGMTPLVWNDPLRFDLFGEVGWTRANLDDTSVGDLDLFKGVIGLSGRHDGFYPMVLRGRVSAGLLSDLKEIDGNDARVRGNLMVEWPVVEGLDLLLGSAYDEALGDDEWHLVGGVRWQPSPVFLLELQYPKSRLIVAPSEGLALTAQAGYSGNNWAIFHEKQEYNFRVKSFVTELGAEAEFADGLWLRLFGGLITDQSVDVWKAARRPIQGSADDTYYGGIALIWR